VEELLSEVEGTAIDVSTLLEREGGGGGGGGGLDSEYLSGGCVFDSD
jgi:hypothetical protein